MAEAKYQELKNLITNAPITTGAKDLFGDALDSAVELMDNYHEWVPLLDTERYSDNNIRRIVEQLYIRAIWRGMLILAVEEMGVSPQNLNVFTQLLGGMRQLEACYPELTFRVLRY